MNFENIYHEKFNDLDCQFDIYLSPNFKNKNRSVLKSFIEETLLLKDNLENLNLSISHTDELGAVITSHSYHFSVGIDIEQTQRLSFKAVRRISDDNEISNENWKFLWPIKEACFKTIGRPNQSQYSRIKTLSEIKVTALEIKNNRIYFESNFQQSIEINGVAFQYLDHLVAIAYAKINFVK